MPMTPENASHYRVVCVLCRKDAYVCPERQGADINMPLRAVRAFQRGGWHQDVDHGAKEHKRGLAADYGGGKWFCPACASKRP